MSELDIILDNSRQNLREVPSNILQMHNLKMLYLQQNLIKEIPKDFFQNLRLLTWLDLRNNHIVVVPKGIAHHAHLENLLLSENKIQALPNELGLLPKLKVLQVANNPLAYPNSRVVAEGTKAVVKYLRDQYQKECPLFEAQIKDHNIATEDSDMTLEKEIRVMADYCNELFPYSDPLDGSLVVKGLSKSKSHKDDSGIIHKLTNSSPNKTLLRSYFDEDPCLKKASTQTTDSIIGIPSSFKQTFLDKLRELLDQQERILQQERNLQTLSSWRTEKTNEPLRQVSSEKRAPPPFATDHQYGTFSREDMRKEIDKMIQYSKDRPKPQDVEKLISDLVGQLKEMESCYGGLESARTEIESAGTQIIKIMEMHKKIVQLREKNDMILQ